MCYGEVENGSEIVVKYVHTTSLSDHGSSSTSWPSQHLSPWPKRFLDVVPCWRQSRQTMQCGQSWKRMMPVQLRNWGGVHCRSVEVPCTMWHIISDVAIYLIAYFMLIIYSYFCTFFCCWCSQLVYTSQFSKAELLTNSALRPCLYDLIDSSCLTTHNSC